MTHFLIGVLLVIVVLASPWWAVCIYALAGGAYMLARFRETEREASRISPTKARRR